MIPPFAGRRTPQAVIDWQQAIQDEVREQQTRSGAKTPQFGFPQRPAAVSPTPEFGWDYARTHRVEPLPGGGMLINLTDRCALVLYGILIPVCKIGSIPVNGHLFDHMRDRRSDRQRGLPWAG
jgi:hypothetical protein